MAKRMKFNQRRENKDNIKKIIAALDADITTVTKISKATNITRAKIHKIFREDRSLHAKYIVARRTIVDQAADNIADIVSDKEHPSHYAASKYVLQTYKSDLDEHLDAKGEEEITAEVDIAGGDDEGVTIVFRHGARKPRGEMVED